MEGGTSVKEGFRRRRRLSHQGQGVRSERLRHGGVGSHPERHAPVPQFSHQGYRSHLGHSRENDRWAHARRPTKIMSAGLCVEQSKRPLCSRENDRAVCGDYRVEPGSASCER